MKMTIMLPKSVPRRSNQEWRSICADTVYTFDLIVDKIRLQMKKRLLV